MAIPWTRLAEALKRPGRDPWFALPVLTCMLADAAVSLACQPAGYWSDPAKYQEGNSVWATLLAAGPAAFGGGFLVYCAVIAALVLWLKGALQKLLGMFALLAHSYGAASWCHVELPDGAYWWALVALLLAEAGAFALWWRLRDPGEAEGRANPTPSAGAD